jgi:hypothetical protein
MYSALLLMIFAVGALLLAVTPGACAEGGGLPTDDGPRLFPIGFYELPSEDLRLKALAEAGVNLVRCHSRADLDRARVAGIRGWVPLPLHEGTTDALRDAVAAMKDHPALEVWEGPDEIVWSFTAASGLEAAAGIKREDWWKQAPAAVEYAERQAQRIIPRLREAIALVRSLDEKRHRIWFNEARRSDAAYVRRYVDSIDITGCDDYPVGRSGRDIARVGDSTERWKQVGRGKPVWMVLQAFSDSDLSRGVEAPVPMYPSFAESRFMAYDVIGHGAGGILYWGSQYVKSAPDFLESILAVTSELAALQPFLVGPEHRSAKVTLIEDGEGSRGRGVRITARQSAKEWLIILLNQDDQRHMGVDVSGLDELTGRRLELLYGSESVAVEGGGFVTRLQPYEVKVFATSRKWETAKRRGRGYQP